MRSHDFATRCLKLKAKSAHALILRNDTLSVRDDTTTQPIQRDHADFSDAEPRSRALCSRYARACGSAVRGAIATVDAAAPAGARGARCEPQAARGLRDHGQDGGQGHAAGADHRLSRACVLARQRPCAPDREPQRVSSLRAQSRRGCARRLSHLRSLWCGWRGTGVGCGGHAGGGGKEGRIPPKNVRHRNDRHVLPLSHPLRRNAFGFIEMLEKTPATTSTSTARPLDAAAILITVVLCLSWGVNQVAIKLALPEIPPLIQSA